MKVNHMDPFYYNFYVLFQVKNIQRNEIINRSYLYEINSQHNIHDRDLL